MKHVSSMPMEMKKKMTVFSFSSDSSSLVKMRLSEMMTPAVPGGMGELLALGSAEPHGSGTPPRSPPPYGGDASSCGVAKSSDLFFWGAVEPGPGRQLPPPSLAWPWETVEEGPPEGPRRVERGRRYSLSPVITPCV